MLSLSYWTGQRLNCWVLSLLLGCTEYFKVAVWVGPTNHRDAKDRKWTNVCVSGSHDFLALMHIDPSRVFRPITCGGLVFQKGRTRGRVGRSRLLLWRVKGKALSSSEWVEGGAVTPGSGLGFQLLLSLLQSGVSQLKGYAGVKLIFSRNVERVQIIAMAGFGRKEKWSLSLR